MIQLSFKIHLPKIATYCLMSFTNERHRDGMWRRLLNRSRVLCPSLTDAFSREDRLPQQWGQRSARLLRMTALALFVIVAATGPLQTLAKPTTEEQPLTEPTEEVLEELRFLEEETVGIAARHEQPISEAPSNVYVITDEDIRRSGATDIPTILRRVPGMEVIQMTGADVNVSVRGNNQLRANKLLVLVDGRSVFIDVQAEVLWKTFPVRLPEIKRIEVLKGPASAVYGFNAFDGVVNIITKSPEEMKGATVQFGGGELGTISSSAIYANKVGKLGYRLSFGHDQNEEWEDGEALAFRSYKFNGQINYDLPGQSTLKISGGLVDTNRYDGPIVDILKISQNPEQGYAHILYERPNLLLRAYWTGLDQPSEILVDPRITDIFPRITDRSGSSSQALDWNSYNLEGQHAIDFGTDHRLTYGLNYRRNEVESNFLDKFSLEDRFGLYVQDEWRMTKSLTAVTGVRLDLHSEINPTYSPRFALLYKPVRDHTFRATVAVAYRPPTIFETNTESFLEVSGFGDSELEGSDDLEHEQIISYELGYQGWFFRHRLRVRADLFFNHISDLISNIPLPSGNSTFANGGEADIYGGEAGIEFLVTPWLSGFANYAYQEIGQTLQGQVQRGAPRFKVNAGLRGEWENGLNAETSLHYVGSARYAINSDFSVLNLDNRVGSYTLLNLRGGYWFWNERAEVAVSLFNALNDKHREHPLGERIGSRAMGWLTIKLD